MPDRRTEARRDRARCGIPGAHGQQGDLVVEVDAFLDDDDTRSRTRVLLGVSPCECGLLGAGHAGLAMPGGGHRWLDESWVADLVECGGQLSCAVREAESRGAHAGQRRGEGADALAVHRGLDGKGVGDDAHTAFLRGAQAVSGNGLYLGNNEVDVTLV